MQIRKNVWKLIILLGLAGVVLSFTVSCTSLPAPVSEDDSAFIVPVKKFTGSDGMLFGFLRFTVRSVSNPDVVRKIDIYPMSDHQFISGLNAGEYLVEKMQFHYKDGGKGKAAPLNIRFTTSPGRVKILPFMVELKAYQEDPDSRRYIISYDMLKLEKENREEVIRFFSGEENFPLWKIEA